MRIGLVGKPNVGKSTLFAAATLAPAAIGNYPFTTIEPNHGVGFVRVEDPGPEMRVVSTPRTGRVVVEGARAVRYVPVDLVDVAGLVPGAHAGRGLGNRFLSHLAQADALVHVVDAAGATDAEGNSVPAGSNDPLADVRFLTDEIDQWITGILNDGWERLAKRMQMEGRKPHEAIAERLGGIGVSDAVALKAMRDSGLAGRKPGEIGPGDLAALARAIRSLAKPMVVALNKADLLPRQALDTLMGTLGGGIPVAAQAELALMKGVQAGVIAYHPGAGTFTTTGGLSAGQEKGLTYVREHVLVPFGETGVTRVLEEAAFRQLGLVPVFPVEDETRLTDKEGRVLPDCHLVPTGTTARELAFRVHTDLGEHFIRAIDCRTKRAIGAEHPLRSGDVVKIFAKA